MNHDVNLRTDDVALDHSKPGRHDRRRFMQYAGGLAAGSLLLSQATPAAAQRVVEKPPPNPQDAIPIVDAHQHLWDREKFRLSWVTPGTPLARNFVLDDYRAATDGLNVVQTVYMEVDVAPEQQQAEADYISDLCRAKDSHLAGAIVSGRPEADGFAKYAKQFKNSHEVKGLRRVLHGNTPAGYCLQKPFVASLQLLGELGLSFDICIRAAELTDAAALAEQCPHTQFVLDHCGNANLQATAEEGDAWKRDIAAVAKHKNVACKVSGFVASAGRKLPTAEMLAPIINHVCESFGPDRVLFGGDWPVCTQTVSLREWITLLKAVIRDRPLPEQRKLLHDNARVIYRLA